MEAEEKEIDRIIGQNLRTLRKQAGMSQAALGQTVGITFQQIQKYESGQNRIAGSRMYQFAAIFAVSPLSFFQGVPGVPANMGAEMEPQVMRLAQMIMKAQGGRYGRHIDHFVAASLQALEIMAEEDSTDDS